MSFRKPFRILSFINLLLLSLETKQTFSVLYTLTDKGARTYCLTYYMAKQSQIDYKIYFVVVEQRF